VDCELCHGDDLARADSPDHAAQGWTEDCGRCHFPSTWGASGFRHSFFPLTAGHAGLECNACHTSGSFGPIPADCNSCHADDYAGAPGHASSNFPRTCQQCHNTSSWENATFRHQTFQLTGGHAGLECNACHTSGSYGTIPSDCFSCHAEEYNGAPAHVSSNFPRDCRQCHTTSTWAGAAVNHDFFPLQGGHAGLDCSRCHTSGTTGPIPANCYACHRADYEGASNHASLGFPTSCEQCHTIQRWDGATFRHTFPLRGEHNVSCNVCHPGTTQTFTCLVCHEHNRTDTDREHREVSGYRYESQACLQCHRNGEGD
jgi:hypothetical protein